ncbi:MAG TPA: ADP-ribosylglycohydrolase family protein [Pirellulaceae bacterium]|nr:ADP-ribosylglycohydrolase family protein [Pirellulaceae bacterium]
MSMLASTPCRPLDRADVIGGCLLGMAIGDALGLPREGLSARRAEKLFGAGEIRHRLALGRGMISDDTEHACMTAQALLAAGTDVKRFQNSLAWRLRWWLLGVPVGIGLGTLRAILRLWIGVSPRHSGVRSAGNGPAMRAPIIGVLLADTPDSMKLIAQASTRITHRDIRADQGAMAIAIAAAYAARPANLPFQACKALEHVRNGITEPKLLKLLDKVREHLEQGASPAALAADMELTRGITGYIYHTVPIALFCWLRYYGDFRESVTQAIRLGGDTDTVAAITGALAGASVGQSGIPKEWLDGLIEWPRSVYWMENLTARLAQQFPEHGDAEIVGPLPIFWPGQLLRNLVFAILVLGHGFRRIFPPY